MSRVYFNNFYGKINGKSIFDYQIDKDKYKLETIEESDTVGILICKQNNEYVIKYCSDDRIIAREYELV